MQSKLLLILLLLKATAAQRFQNSGYVYAGDSLQTANIAVNSFFILVIAVTLIASIISVSKTPTRRRSCNPYSVLSITLFFSLISLAFDLAILIIEANRNLFFGFGNAYVAVFGISEYIYSWTMSLFFLAFSLILLSIPVGTKALNSVTFDIKSAFASSRASKFMTLFSIGYFAVLIVLASVTIGFYVSYLRDAFLVRGFQTAGNLSQRLLRYQHVSYVFDAFLYATMLGFAVMLAIQYYSLRRLGERGLSLPYKKLAFIAFPLYVLLMSAQIAFTIVNPPPGIQAPQRGNIINIFRGFSTQSEIESLMFTILVWGLFSSTSIALLVVGSYERRIISNYGIYEAPFKTTRKWYQRPMHGLKV